MHPYEEASPNMELQELTGAQVDDAIGKVHQSTLDENACDNWRCWTEAIVRVLRTAPPADAPPLLGHHVAQIYRRFPGGDDMTLMNAASYADELLARRGVRRA